jgi:hypothetical protein
VVYVESIEGVDNIQFDYLPALFIEVIGKSIRSRRLLIWQTSYRLLNLTLRKGPVQLESGQLLQLGDVYTIPSDSMATTFFLSNQRLKVILHYLLLIFMFPNQGTILPFQ